MTPDPLSARAQDAAIAEALGHEIADLSWPCGYVPDGCEMEVYEPVDERYEGETDERFDRRRVATEEYREAFLNRREPVYWLHHENGWNQRCVVKFYSSDPIAFEALLGEIGRRGLGPRYINVLAGLLQGDETLFESWSGESYEVWAMWSAPRSTKAAAALAVLKEAKT